MNRSHSRDNRGSVGSSSRGKLVFKGVNNNHHPTHQSDPSPKSDPPLKRTLPSNSKTNQQHKHKKKKRKSSLEENILQSFQSPEKEDAILTTAMMANNVPAPAIPIIPDIVIRDGTGRLTLSGTVATGSMTRFQSELRVGDAIMMHHRVNNNKEEKEEEEELQRSEQEQKQKEQKEGEEEMRIVTMILSDTSMSISSPFSSVMVRRPFRYISNPSSSHSSCSFSTSTNHNISTKDHPAESSSSSASLTAALLGTSRSDMLAMRTKKKSDKYC